MRPIVIAAVICVPAYASAETPLMQGAGDLPVSERTIFRLGGAASRAAVAPTMPIEEDKETSGSRLSLPLNFPDTVTASTQSDVGAATFFLSERLDGGRDALEVGTFLRRGQARAGVSVTYLEDEADLARSELFVDYAITEQLSVGLSGILNAELDDRDPVRQLGVNAEFATEGGAFVQGGVAGAVDYDPVIGVSVGLRF
ncbi:MAG: hypothetical protein AAFY31_00575 [Pseudomonadota bacterium]